MSANVKNAVTKNKNVASKAEVTKAVKNANMARFDKFHGKGK